MPIPAIHSYRMPAEDELPANTAAWRIDPDRAALLIHDMQAYFLQPFPQHPRTQLLAHVAALRDAATAAAVPVLYTAQPGGMSPTDRGLLHDFWGPGMSADPAHRAIPAPLTPRSGECVLTKWRPSAFCRTDLLDRLRSLGRDQLIVCGVYAHVGIVMTAHDSFSHDIQTFVVGDAVADFSRRPHVMALDYASARCAVTVATRTAVAQLQSDRSQ